MGACPDCNEIHDSRNPCRRDTHAAARIHWAWHETARRILVRDRHTCQMCQRRPPEGDLRVEHVVPLRNFRRLPGSVPASSDDNLRTLCRDCYRWKTHQQARWSYQR